MKKTSRFQSVLVYAFVLAMVFAAIGPFVYVLLSSLKTLDQIYDINELLPRAITWNNYATVLFQSKFARYFLNSVFMAVTTTLICMTLSVMAAYGFTRFRILGAHKIKMTVLFTRMFPGILLCIPYYVIMKSLNLVDSYAGLCMMYCSFTLPFAIWNTCAFFAQLPWDLEEAAMIDGCSRAASFFRIILHVAKPGLGVTALFTFLSTWDEYMYSMIFISTPEKKTIQVGMKDFIGQYQTEWGLLMAAVILSLIPVMIFFAVVQKNLVTGLSAGAVKG